MRRFFARLLPVVSLARRDSPKRKRIEHRDGARSHGENVGRIRRRRSLHPETARRNSDDCCDQFWKAATRPSPISRRRPFSPGLAQRVCRVWAGGFPVDFARFVGAVLAPLTLKMPSSVMFGSRPRFAECARYSSRVTHARRPISDDSNFGGSGGHISNCKKIVNGSRCRLCGADKHFDHE